MGKQAICIRCDGAGDRDDMRALYTDPCDPDGDNAEPRFWLCPACADEVTAAELRRAAAGLAREVDRRKAGPVINIAVIQGLCSLTKSAGEAAASAEALGKARRALDEGEAT
jgi:hypothetical protein